MGIPTVGQVGIPALAHFPLSWENPPMENLAEILPKRVQARLDALGKSKRGVSLAIGAHAGYVRDLFDPERFNVPSAVRLETLAQELETTTEYLLGKADSPAQVYSEVGVGEAPMRWNGPPRGEPPIPVVGTGDCAELELADETGHLVTVERSSFDADYHVRYIARPPALSGARDLYAIYFHGTSMLPRFEPGEIGIVDPRRPVNSGDYVLVQLAENGDGAVSSVLVKRLVRQTAVGYLLEQFNPPTLFTVPRAMVARIHRVMRNTDQLL